VLAVAMPSASLYSCHPSSIATAAQSAAELKHSVDSLVPTGITVREARTRIEHQQFGCVPSDEAIPNGPPDLRALYCAGPTTLRDSSRYWLVVLLHVHDTTVGTHVRTLVRSR
jgi:hypothetical protein